MSSQSSQCQMTPALHMHIRTIKDRGAHAQAAPEPAASGNCVALQHGCTAVMLQLPAQPTIIVFCSCSRREASTVNDVPGKLALLRSSSAPTPRLQGGPKCCDRQRGSSNDEGQRVDVLQHVRKSTLRLENCSVGRKQRQAEEG